MNADFLKELFMTIGGSTIAGIVIYKIMNIKGTSKFSTLTDTVVDAQGRTKTVLKKYEPMDCRNHIKQSLRKKVKGNDKKSLF